MARVRRRRTAVQLWTAGLIAIASIASGGSLGATQAGAAPLGQTTVVAAAPTPSQCTTGSDGTTCINTGPFARAYNPATRKLAPVPRQATVSKTTGLTSETVDVSWKYFTPSSVRNASGQGFYYVEVLECQTAQPTSLSQCFGSKTYPIAEGDVSADSNEVLATTGTDYTQSIQFPVLSGADEPSLGCSPTTQCSLLILPDAGGVSPTDCNSHAGDTAGFAASANATSAGDVEDHLCDWYSRIVVPLTFAASADDCPDVTPQFTTAGSPLDARAMDLWRAGLCTGSHALTIGYTDLDDYQARAQFDLGATQVGLTTQPEQSPNRPLTYAPLTNTAMVVSYYLDNPETGEPITGIRLDARLLAKMLTQSYPGQLPTANCAASDFPCASGLAGNPTSLYSDPEFLSLNPQVAPIAKQLLLNYGASFPDVVFGDNDSTEEVTSWIAADPAAASFLAGHPDPWGMKVNPAYLPAKLGYPAFPASAFVANDPGSIKEVPGPTGGCGDTQPGAVCRYQGTQILWNPINGLRNVATQQLSGLDSGKSPRPDCTTQVPAPLVCDSHAGDPREILGTRAVFAITSAADAAAYQFPTAALQTSATTFVAPTAASETAALMQMKAGSTGVEGLDYTTLKDPAAYPLTMTTYAMVATCGLTTASAASIRSFVGYVASDAGETSGTLPGNLAPGYLPLTATQRGQAIAAAAKAGTTACPALITPSQAAGLPTTGARSSNGLGGAGLSGSGLASSAGGSGTGEASPSSTGSAASRTEPQEGSAGLTTQPVSAVGRIDPQRAAAGGTLLLIVLIAGLVLLTAAAQLTLVATGRAARMAAPVTAALTRGRSAGTVASTRVREALHRGH